MDEQSRILFEQYRAGDSRAADALFSRYVEQLTRLARSRLSQRLARRIDPEDVVLSAYRSFFLGARDGRFVIQRSGDLWALLVKMTLNKLCRQAARHQARARSIDAEATPGEMAIQLEACLSREPSPEDALLLADEVDRVFAKLGPAARQVLERRLADETIEEIAAGIGRSERTVRRILAEIRELLAAREMETGDAGP